MEKYNEEKMLILGLVLIGQSYARLTLFEREQTQKKVDEFQNPQHYTPEQIATMIYEKDPRLTKIKEVSKEEDIKLIRDLLDTWGAEPNTFLNTPVNLSRTQRAKVMTILTYLKRHYRKTKTTNPKKYAKAVDRYMKGLSNIERAYVLFASGVNPADLPTNYTQYSGFYDKIKGKKAYRNKMYKFIEGYEKKRRKFLPSN